MSKRSWLAIGLCAVLSACQAPVLEQASAVPSPYDDGAIRTIIDRRFQADQALSDQEIEVGVADGVVLLSGSVHSESLRAKAVRLAGTVQGVLRVEDRLQLAQP